MRERLVREEVEARERRRAGQEESRAGVSEWQERRVGQESVRGRGKKRVVRA